MKVLPWSEMMERGIPCNQTTSLVNFATITMIMSIPPDLGNPSTKSIDRSSHTCWGIRSGWRSPVGASAEVLNCWHRAHWLTWCLMSLTIPHQKNWGLMCRYVCRNPPCLFNTPSWHSARSFGMSGEVRGKTTCLSWCTLRCWVHLRLVLE